MITEKEKAAGGNLRLSFHYRTDRKIRIDRNNQLLGELCRRAVDYGEGSDGLRDPYRTHR